MLFRFRINNSYLTVIKIYFIVFINKTHRIDLQRIWPVKNNINISFVCQNNIVKYFERKLCKFNKSFCFLFNIFPLSLSQSFSNTTGGIHNNMCLMTAEECLNFLCDAA